MMNTPLVMKMSDDASYVCVESEKLSNHSRKIAELETRANYKDKRIDELYSKMEDIDSKLDKIADNVHFLQIQSVQDDNDIDKRVTSLENTVSVIKYLITLVFGSGILWIVLSHW